MPVRRQSIHVSCAVCAFLNASASLYCRGCYRPLTDGVEADPPGDAGDRFVLLAQACELARVQNWDNLHFHTWLQAFVDEQQLREISIQELEIPYEFAQDFALERDIGLKGVRTCNEGLSRLREYTTDDGPMLDGLRLFWRGVCMIREAMRINRLNAGCPLWLY